MMCDGNDDTNRRGKKLLKQQLKDEEEIEQ
jgi:hypothetical protein